MKKMKITNGDVKALIEVIDAIETHPEIKMDIKCLYALSRNRAKLTSKDKITENVRLNLVNKYGEKKENGIIKVSDKNIEVFQRDWFELLSEEVEIDFYPISISQLEESSKKMGGIKNLHLLFDYIVNESKDGETKKKKSKVKKMETV